MDVAASTHEETSGTRPGIPSASGTGIARANELNRTQACRLLRLNKSTFRAREKQGRYRACRIDERGFKYYDKASLLSADGGASSEVLNAERTIEAPISPQPLPPVLHDPDQVRKVFGELERDEDLVRIVLATDLSPRTVLEIHASWTTLKRQGGGLYVSKRVLDELDQLQLEGFPARSEGELLAALVAIRDGVKNCERCRRSPRKPPTLCGPCEREVRSIERAEAERVATLQVMSKRGHAAKAKARR